MNKLILDCDTGEDDALAILLALANKLPLKYVVTSYGNTSVKNSTINTSKILSLANAQSVKVISGSEKPLVKHPIEKEEYSAGDFVGKNGLCNVKLLPSKFDNVIYTSSSSFSENLVEIIKNEGPFDYIVTGPCTNLAKLCQELGSQITKYIKNVYVMGGAIYANGNSGPIDKANKQHAEFNFYCDPYSASQVLKSGLKINLVTWDITSRLMLSYDEISSFTSKTQVGKFAVQLMKSFFRYYGLDNNRNFELNDPVTIIAYLRLGKFVTKKIATLIQGPKAGKTILDSNGYKVSYFKVIDKEFVKSKILSDLGIQR